MGVGGTARTAIAIGTGMSMQLDLASDTFVTTDEYPGDFDLGTLSAAMHLSFREPEQHLYGIFVQYDRTEDGGDDGTLGGVVVGGEGAVFLDNVTIYGQAGYTTGIHGANLDDPTYDYAVWFANIESRYFVSDNTRLELGAGILSGDYYTDSGYDATAATWNVGLEHRLQDSPLSAFVRGRGFAVMDDGGNLDLSSAAVGEIGIKMAFGSSSLREEDRSGATLRHSNAQKVVNWLRYD